MPTRFDLTIAAADVICRLGTLTITEILNGRNTLTCEILSLDAAYRPAKGAEVIGEDGIGGSPATRIFGGNISAPAEHAIDDQLIEEFATTVQAADFNAIADRITVVGGGFPPGFTVKQAATSLLGYLTPYGVTLDPAQADGPVLPLMQYDIKRVSAWFNEISVITGWVWEIDYNKVLRFIEPGTVPAPWSVADDDGHTVGDILVEPSDLDYANRVIVLAGEGQREVTEALTFNGTDDFIDLTYTMVGHRGYITVNAVNETLGGSPAFWMADPVIANRIVRVVGAPAAGTGEIIYTAQFPYIAQADDVPAQGGPRGIVDAVIPKKDVFDATLADALAAGYLARMVAEPDRIRYATFTSGLHPGMTQAIQSSVRGINLTALITEVRAQDIDGETMRYDVTAVEGDVYPGSWGDMYRDWSGGGGGGSSSGGGSVTVVSSGGVGGAGTPGSLAQWMTPSTLGDATAVPAALLTGTIASAVQDAITRVGTLVSGATGAGFTIALSTSTLTGNLPYARMPSGSGTWTATPTISGATVLSSTLAVTGVTTFTTHANPALNYTSNLGSIDKKYLTLHAAELWVETLVAQNTIATIGGRILVGPTTTLTADLASGGTTITVKHNQIANGDRVYMEVDGKVEWMAVTSGAGGSAGAYTYTVTRNLDGSGANDWYAGDAVFNTGTTGDGFLDLYSVSGVLSGSGPTITANVRTGTTYNNIATRAAFGNLNGHYGIATDLYGVAMGDPSGANMVLDATNGLRIRDGTTVYAVLASSTFRIGASGGNRVEWNGTTLTVVSDTVSIDNAGIRTSAPSTSYDTIYAYRFTPDGNIGGSSWGVFAKNASATQRYIGLLNVSTTNQKQTFVEVRAETKDAGGSAVTAVLTAFADGTTGAGSISSNVALAVPSLTITTNGLTVSGGASLFAGGRIDVSISSSGAWAGEFTNASSTGFGIFVQAGSTSSEYCQLWQTYNGGTNLGWVLGDGTWANISTTWTAISDSRAKRHIRDYGAALDKIRRVRITEFEYTSAYGLPGGRRSVGPIAEEIREIFPSCVTSRRVPLGATRFSDEEILLFNPHELFMATVAATKELAAHVDDHERRIRALEGQ